MKEQVSLLLGNAIVVNKCNHYLIIYITLGKQTKEGVLLNELFM